MTDEVKHPEFSSEAEHRAYWTKYVHTKLGDVLDCLAAIPPDQVLVPARGGYNIGCKDRTAGGTYADAMQVMHALEKLDILDN